MKQLFMQISSLPLSYLNMKYSLPLNYILKLRCNCNSSSLVTTETNEESQEELVIKSIQFHFNEQSNKLIRYKIYIICIYILLYICT